MSERDKNQIGLKWPLSEARIKLDGGIYTKLEEVIKSQLNIKEIKIDYVQAGEELSIKLDTKLTPELEAEGYARVISRKVQSFRKDLGLEKNQKIELQLIVEDDFKKILESKSEFIKERTNSKELFFATGEERFKKNIEFKVKDKKGVIGVKITTKR